MSSRATHSCLEKTQRDQHASWADLGEFDATDLLYLGTFAFCLCDDAIKLHLARSHIYVRNEISTYKVQPNPSRLSDAIFPHPTLRPGIGSGRPLLTLTLTQCGIGAGATQPQSAAVRHVFVARADAHAVATALGLSKVAKIAESAIVARPEVNIAMAALAPTFSAKEDFLLLAGLLVDFNVDLCG